MLVGKRGLDIADQSGASQIEQLGHVSLACILPLPQFADDVDNPQLKIGFHNDIAHILRAIYEFIPYLPPSM